MKKKIKIICEENDTFHKFFSQTPQQNKIVKSRILSQLNRLRELL